MAGKIQIKEQILCTGDGRQKGERKSIILHETSSSQIGRRKIQGPVRRRPDLLIKKVANKFNYSTSLSFLQYSRYFSSHRSGHRSHYMNHHTIFYSSKQEAANAHPALLSQQQCSRGRLPTKISTARNRNPEKCSRERRRYDRVDLPIPKGPDRHWIMST